MLSTENSSISEYISKFNALVNMSLHCTFEPVKSDASHLNKSMEALLE